ncbi:MAG: right-handed parallel beta-helix repeat-containing protein [Dissulfurispiraceae bacterium]|nr:right-handed parallel beta-helix repeat-containing protein [Dissulfurispiraceae bacterium]
MLFLILLTVVLCFSVNPCSSDEHKRKAAGIEEITSRKYAKTIHIPAGSYNEPYIINTPDAEYILDGDITADGTAVQIKSSRVTINLNGKAITYNQKKPGDGIAVGAWNLTDISIINGTVIQGQTMSEGDQYGAGNNPVRTVPFYVKRLYVGNIHAKYGGRDVGGIVAASSDSIFENNVLEDLWTSGTFKNRHQGIDALAGSKHIRIETNNIYRNNTIKDCRHRGISAGNNSIIHNNNISINSLATNSTGISFGPGSKVYDNTITGRGEHPIGIFYVSKAGEVEIFNNTIDVQTTKLGDEYEAAGGNFAAGFRTTWGGNNINFHNNKIIVRTDSNFKGSYSSTGKPVIVNSKGRGLMVAVNAGEKAVFSNNEITVLDKDGTGKAYGIACTGNNVGEMIFEKNIVKSNVLNVALGDAYGACAGYPLFIRNTFIKVDNYSTYRTVSAELGGYYEGTGRFVSNIYKDGASQENININPKSRTKKSLLFGQEVVIAVIDTKSNKPIPGVAVEMKSSDIQMNVSAVTEAYGSAKIIFYEYELHNQGRKQQIRRTDHFIIKAFINKESYQSKAVASGSLKFFNKHEIMLYDEMNQETGKKILISN